MGKRKHRGNRVLGHRSRVDSTGGGQGDAAANLALERVIGARAQKLNPFEPWRNSHRLGRDAEGEQHLASVGRAHQFSHFFDCAALAIDDFGAGNGALDERALRSS